MKRMQADRTPAAPVPDARQVWHWYRNRGHAFMDAFGLMFVYPV